MPKFFVQLSWALFSIIEIASTIIINKNNGKGTEQSSRCSKQKNSKTAPSGHLCVSSQDRWAALSKITLSAARGWSLQLAACSPWSRLRHQRAVEASRGDMLCLLHRTLTVPKHSQPSSVVGLLPTRAPLSAFRRHPLPRTSRARPTPRRGVYTPGTTRTRHRHTTSRVAPLS